MFPFPLECEPAPLRLSLCRGQGQRHWIGEGFHSVYKEERQFSASFHSLPISHQAGPLGHILQILYSHFADENLR